MKKIGLFLSMLLLPVTLLIGCGDDNNGGGGEPTDPPVTQEDLAAEIEGDYITTMYSDDGNSKVKIRKVIFSFKKVDKTNATLNVSEFTYGGESHTLLNVKVALSGDLKTVNLGMPKTESKAPFTEVFSLDGRINDGDKIDIEFVLRISGKRITFTSTGQRVEEEGPDDPDADLGAAIAGEYNMITDLSTQAAAQKHVLTITREDSRTVRLETNLVLYMNALPVRMTGVELRGTDNDVRLYHEGDISVSGLGITCPYELEGRIIDQTKAEFTFIIFVGTEEITFQMTSADALPRPDTDVALELAGTYYANVEALYDAEAENPSLFSFSQVEIKIERTAENVISFEMEKLYDDNDLGEYEFNFPKIIDIDLYQNNADIIFTVEDTNTTGGLLDPYTMEGLFKLGVNPKLELTINYTNDLGSFKIVEILTINANKD